MEASPASTLPPRVRFPGLSSAAIEHPGDRAALEALRRTPGLDRLLKWLSDLGAERFVKILFTADSLRISPRQCSRLYNDLREACAILDVQEPEFYLWQTPVPNAFAVGMQRYTIVITSGLVDMMTDSERLSVIAHELGHIKAEHMLYRTMAILLAELMHEAVGGMALPGAILTGALAYTLFAWFRRSEFTCDRAGLLAVQDPDVCVSSLLKLAGGTQRLVDDLNTEEFLKQADVYEDMDEDVLSLYYKFMMVRWQTHPFLAVRAREVKEWGQSEQYRRLLRGDYPRTNTEAGRRTCGSCGTVISNVTFQFCPECGKPLDPVK
jgi:Zn-dependent protease with chaperone function